MAKKSLVDSFNKNKPEPEPELSPQEKIKCSAPGCPLAGSQNRGGDKWVCTYHALAGGEYQWPHITKVINDHEHYQRMLKAVKAVKAHEFDDIQQRGAWAVHDLIKPIEGENHSHWQGRAQMTIHRAIKQKVHEALDDQANRFSSEGRSISKAVKELTTGVLINKKSQKRQAVHGH